MSFSDDAIAILPLVGVLEELRGAQDHVDDRADEGEHRQRDGGAHEAGGSQAPPGVLRVQRISASQIATPNRISGTRTPLETPTGMSTAAMRLEGETTTGTGSPSYP